MDNIVEDEIARIYAKPIYSQHELDVMGEMVGWAMFADARRFPDQRSMIDAYWNERLN